MTTPIEVHFRDSVPNFASAFYFEKVAPPPDPNKAEPQWRAMQGLYLVTAKHVIAPSRINNLVSVTFFLRKAGLSGTDWLPIKLSAQDVRKRLHLSPKPAVDVAALDILDLVTAQVKGLIPAQQNQGDNTIPLEPFWGVTEDNLADRSKIKVSAGDDVIVIGYPRRFFDSFNKLPILKLGLLITPLGARYDNMDAFLIDFKEYEGLSGGVVIGKPTNMVIDDVGRIMINKSKDFVFLGVYAGQRYRMNRDTKKESSADLGIVWYAYNLIDAINSPAFSTPKQ
jgi:hypothetical protein